MRAWAVPVLLAAAAAAAGGADAPAQEPDPHARARHLFRKRCSACHAPDRVNHRTASRGEWREIVQRMQRMPQSGITPAEAEILIAYLARRAAPERKRVGGRAAYGDAWLAVLEVKTIVDGAVTLGGVAYDATVADRSVLLRRDGREHVVALDDAGRVARTARLAAWKVGGAVYETHLALYEIRGGRVRVARALRRLPPP